MHRLAHLAYVLLVEINREAHEFFAIALEFLDHFAMERRGPRTGIDLGRDRVEAELG